MAKFFTASVDSKGENVKQEFAVTVNPKYVLYCEDAGDTTFIYFTDPDRYLRVIGTLDEVTEKLGI